jgi:uncharacterized protein (TIGR00266 family)
MDAGLMKTEFEFSPSFTMMTAHLAPGEQMKVEPGAMVAQSPSVNMKSGMSGGLMKGFFKSMVGGESFFLNTFTADNSGGWVSISPSTPGDIKSFDLAPGQNLFMQGGAFIASTVNVETNTKFQGMKGLFSGESAFFLKASTTEGNGTVFYTAYGAIKEIDITPENPVIVDTGHVVAFSDGVNYKNNKVGGLGSTLVGGEGLVLNFSGNGKVWIQTRNIQSLAAKLIPFMPTRSN